MVGGTRTRSIWNGSVQVSRLRVDQVKFLGLQYGLFFRLGMFRCDVLCNGWEQSLEEPIQEDPVIKLDFSQATALPPLMDMISDVGGSVLVIG